MHPTTHKHTQASTGVSHTHTHLATAEQQHAAYPIQLDACVGHEQKVRLGIEPVHCEHPRVSAAARASGQHIAGARINHFLHTKNQESKEEERRHRKAQSEPQNEMEEEGGFQREGE
jgi:hypothetical protein